MNLSLERGKHIAAGFCYVDFILRNSDIMSTLCKAPLRISRTSQNKYSGSIFGLSITIECIDSKSSYNQGMVRTVSDVSMPFGLGGTYAKVSQTYYAINDNTTSLDLELELKLRGAIRLYFWFRKTAVGNYIDRVCCDIEKAAKLIVSSEYKNNEKLSDEQRSRIDDFVRSVRTSRHVDNIANESLEASVSIAVVKNIAVVQADAIMPDKHFVSAKHELSYDIKKSQNICEAAGRLARINNPAFTFRGETEHEILNIEFRQAAFEFGHNLFNEYLAGNLTSIMPILSYHGKQTFLRFVVDEKLESLPWEALHDGKDFLSTKLRFARSVGVTRQRAKSKESAMENFGILLIGCDSRDDLPGAVVEAESVGQILSKAGAQKVEVLKGSKANRQNVVNAISKGCFNVLHFSGHSVFNRQYPYQSYLELAHGSKLYLHELDHLNNNTAGGSVFDLIFLNSCQSGLATIDHTSGRSLSLCRVLREAGVENVIGMLWNVSDDAAVQVASTFYEYIATGAYINIAEALRQTRCKVAIDRAWQDGSWLAPVLYA